MTQDTEETPVLFRATRGKKPEIIAIFPCEPFTRTGDTMTCYVHVGQHGECDRGYIHRTRAAKPEEYASLKAELEGAPFGYRLKVYSRMQRWMRKAFAAEVRRLGEPKES